MTKSTLDDYPLYETRGDKVAGPGGTPLNSITLDALMAGEVSIEDLRISREALMAQADIARAAGRDTLAQNFERGAELIDVPQEVIMQTYEMLRPGRVEASSDLIAQADLLRREYGATLIADFLLRAADIYKKRGLLTR